ncbi:MAG TPA: energy transducer TonB [Gemmatimonadales bacterium]|nr:energy transducer TonB [Gemmatimonadales bacterium]
MFDTLIESKHKGKKSVGETFLSLAIHGLLILLAVKLTAGAVEKAKDLNADTNMVFLKPPPPPPPPPEQPPPDVVVSANPPPQGFQTVLPPDQIPTEIPPVDLNQKPFDPRDFSGKGVEGGIAAGVVGGTGKVDIENTVVQATAADEVPLMVSPGPQVVPPGLQGVPGQVVAKYIVDTTGHAEPSSWQIISSTNKLFEEPARTMIMKSVFKPGKVAGRPVRVQVQQAISFRAQ